MFLQRTISGLRASLGNNIRHLSCSKITRSNVNNKNLASMDDDYLYHLGLAKGDKDQFSDVKYFVAGGSASRAEYFAKQLGDKLGLLPFGIAPTPIGKTQRYTTYKVGPALISSHGIGQASFSVILHEVTKLLHYAGAEDATYFRIGTSGGLGVEPGTVVVTSEAVNGEIQPQYNLPVLGQVRSFPTKMDSTIAPKLHACAGDSINVVSGRTMGTDCFYEGQGRVDGALCDYTLADKMEFLQKLHENGVRNIEMESAMFASFTGRLGIRSAVVCVTLLDRLQGDQVLVTPEMLAEYESRPGELVARFIQSELQG